MKVGLKQGAKGAAVERLHRILTSGGFSIEPGDVERGEFGPSTLEALHALQRQRRLKLTDRIDAKTSVVLLEMEQNINIEINDGAPPPTKKRRPPDEHHGRVQGILIDEDGAPTVDTRVSLFAKDIRSETHLSDATTHKDGKYSIHYNRPKPLNLVVRAYDNTAKVIAQSPTLFAAPAHVQVNLTTATDGVVRTPSVFTKLSTAASAQLGDIPLSSLTEDKDTHELQFLASAIGTQFDDVAYLYIANALGTKNKIRPETFFGIFYQGVPPALDAALASLPDAGIDDSFTSQVLSGVLAHSRSSLDQVLTAAVKANIIPSSYSSVQESELTLIDGLRTQNVGGAHYIRGKTTLNDLLAAGNVNQDVQRAFVQAYADNSGQLGPTWKTLRKDKNFSKSDLATLNTTLSLGELLTGNIPLVKDSLNRLSQNTLPSVQNLALLDEADWVARITEVDPDATTIPQVLPNDTPQQRIARFAKSLAERFNSRYPTTAFAGGLSKATNSSFVTKDELVTFITANPRFKFKTTNIDQYINTNKTALSSAAVDDLKAAQRLHRLSPHYATVDAMKSAGHTSAQSVYFRGRDAFVSEMTQAFGSASLAKMAYARAHMTYATALMAFGQHNQSLNGANFAVMGPPAPDSAMLTNLPDLQALFGSADYFQCEACQSVYSPAAYLVDLLQYLGKFNASGNGVSTARDVLLQRRPDIQYIALDCSNTNTTLPYIDIVNEVLESAIYPPNPPITLIQTTGTSDERRALPQQISQNAYLQTAGVVFPLSLPFDLPFAEANAYIGALGTTRAVILGLFTGAPVPTAKAATIAAVTLGINPEMQKVINGIDGHQAWDRWGLEQNPSMVIDPKTREPIQQTASMNWITALSKVPVLLNRAGLSLQQLYQLLEAVWVTQSPVTLELGTDPNTGLISPDTDRMQFTGVTEPVLGAVLNRANRFLRLWTACGLQMWELDWALGWGGGVLDDSFLVFLSGAIAVQRQLNVPFQEVVGFWMALETRDVTNHLGDEDTVIPSTYSEVFRNPAVLNPALLNPAPLTPAAAANPGRTFPPLGKISIASASQDTPIVVTTTVPHGFQAGTKVLISGVTGNAAALGHFFIATVTPPNSFTLQGSAGAGVGTAAGSGGSVQAELSDKAIFDSSNALTTEGSAITAALGLSADDISAIVAFTGAAPNLKLDTLNVLLRYQRLSSALSLNVSDLILWIQLTNIVAPFDNGGPADTLEFCRRLAVLQATGLAVRDLDYLLRGQSASQSSLTFTPTQATAVLQAVRDAIAKLPKPKSIPIATITNGATTIEVTTAVPAGLQTGTQVSLSGVTGNYAVNNVFTITVTSPNSFSLNSSQLSANPMTGGTITVSAYTVSAIQAILVAALATATSTTANVVTPILAKTGVLPLDEKTVDALLATTVVEATKFSSLIDAFTAVAKGAALFTALKPTETEFAFVILNATHFGWLDPSALPVVPVSTNSYDQFEALLRALHLNRRQSARSPKLFDIFAEWFKTLPTDLPSAIGGPTITIAKVEAGTPIVITTVAPHGLQPGSQVTITGVNGISAANGTFTITVTGTTAFALDGTTGTGTYTSGGTVTQPSLAFALNANVADVNAISAELGAKPPSFAPATRSDSLADIAMLTAIASALDVTVRYAISGSTLVQLAADPATSDTVSAAMGAVQSQYSQSAWYGAIQPVEDALRQSRRDALVAFLLGQGAAPLPPMLTTDDIFNYFLIDPEMCPCAPMTRLLQASLAIQQFVQQCFLSLTFATLIPLASASNTSPIVISTPVPNGLETGSQVFISGLGNLAKDDTYTITVISPTEFMLNANGAGAWSRGGFISIGSATVNTSNAELCSEWSWRKQYRLWQANREVFLYPENYLLPELRKDASSFFTDLENDLRQSNCDADAAEVAIENYLRKLLGVSRLRVAAHYNETKTDGDNVLYVLHVFARTCANPAQWYYRTRTGMTPDAGSWSAWQSLNLDINSQHLLPVIWDQRLYLIWPVFKQISEKQSDQYAPSGGGQTQSAPLKLWSVEFCMSELSAGKWQPKQTIFQKAYFNTQDSPLAFTFRAAQDSAFNLQLQVYWVALEEAITAAESTALSTSLVQQAQAIAQQQASQQQIADEAQLAIQLAAAALLPVPPGLILQLANAAAASGAATQIAPQSESWISSSVLSSTATVDLSWGYEATYIPVFTIEQASGVSVLIATATLQMPESPLTIVELSDTLQLPGGQSQILPSSQYIDTSQEPSYNKISTASMSGQLTTPNNYGFSGQDLVWDNYMLNNSGTVPLILLCSTSKDGPQSQTVLGTILNPHVTIPAQGPVFDSTEPFFVADDTRTYLVQPTFWTISSSPKEIPNLAYISQWSTKLAFRTFYHPYARTFLRELEIGRVDRLMSRDLQTDPQKISGRQAFDFAATYDPQAPWVATPYPGAATPLYPGASNSPDVGETALDFAPASSGAYSLYNWEVFYHIPMFVASLLMQNQQYQDAMTWLEYIFNPADSSGGLAPQRFWEMAPFYGMQGTPDWTNQDIQNLLTNLNLQGGNYEDIGTAIQNWMGDPFDPHAIASLRILAYAKATVMKFLDNLIAWGDWYYNQYTAETVNQAEQLYIFADMILGPKPQTVRMPNANQSGAGTITYASLKNLDQFSNVLVPIENVVVAPEPPQSIIQGTAEVPTLPQLPGVGTTLLFCIPPNDQLLAYWDTVAQRLYNIRHCLNLQGISAPLPLYAPPINPLELIEAQAAGAGFSSATPPAPIYRFSVCLQKAIELTNDVRAYGALILSQLEKDDAETLAALRASQELDIQTRMLDVKTQQVTEATDQISALQNQKAVVQVRYNFYSTVAFMNPWETSAIALQASALALNGMAIPLELDAAALRLLPNLSFGIDGFGGTPSLNTSIGGEQFASAVSAMASMLRSFAGLSTQQAGMASTMGGYQRRMDEWTLQKNIASAELTQIDSQIASAQDRLTIAQKELEIQAAQINNAQAVSDFLTNKYTNAQLYDWMVTQLTTVYTQAYQLAFSLALQAQSAYQYELGSTDNFIQFGYWDSQHKGLTAGESLLFDLRRMETQYLAENSRELELTKHVSVALTSPLSLVMLRETGMCQIALTEDMFDYDHPGQYFRRLRSIALTIPCVTGPYTGVNATLTLTGAWVRQTPPSSSYVPVTTLPPSETANFGGNVGGSPIAAAGTQTICTSSGQNDAGLFDVNLHDERWLPFEGQGAVSTWNLVLDPRDNNFDFTTITDVIMHIRYTARGGGDLNAASIVRDELAKLRPTPTGTRSILVSVHNTFPDRYYTFFNPDAAATEQTLTLPLTKEIFPYTNLGSGVVEIQGIDFYMPLSVSADSMMNASFISSASPDPVKINLSPAQTPAGDSFSALTAHIPPPPGSQPPPPSLPLPAPQAFTLSVSSTDIPAALWVAVNGQKRLDPTKIQDVLLVITYSIG